MEKEVKLGFKDKESLLKVTAADSFRNACLDISGPVPVLLENSYLDSADRFILARGGAVRIRHYADQNNDRYEFTVKFGGGTKDGLHKRHEWNVMSSDGVFSIERFKELADCTDDPEDLLSDVFGDLKDTDLSIICSNSFYRTVYTLKFNSSTIEACIDSGIIRSSDGLKTDEICELELELVQGNEKDLVELSDTIIKETDCSPLDKTKFMRTLALAIEG